MPHHVRARLARATVLALALGLPSAALGLSGGVPSTIFASTGCNACHTGGIAPTVVLSGPTTVDPGATVNYTLTLLSNDAGQDYGGFNVRAGGGVLNTGGPFSAGTETIVGTGGLTEITQSAPKKTDLLNQVDFGFRWTAPVGFVGSVTLTGWGNAVDRNFNSLGDRGAMDTLVIMSSGGSATPTPTPTPGPDYCANPSVPDPPAVSDAEALRCQAAVVKAGALFVKQGLKTVQKCLGMLQSSGAAADPLGVCAGSSAASLPPTDQKAAVALAKTESKVRSLLATKCSNAAVATLGLCAQTEPGLEDCLIDTLHAAVVDAVVSQYGALAPSPDKGEQKCQAAIASTAAGVINAYLKSSSKCLAGWSKSGNPGAGGPLCIGDAIAGGFIMPTDGKVVGALQKAAGKLGDKVNSACTDVQVAALDACGSTRAAAAQCLTCAARGIDGDILRALFGDTN